MHSHIKNPKNTIHCHYYHPCIFIYQYCIFIYCFASFIILISFSHLVLDNHLVRLRAQRNLFVCRKSREGQGDKTTLLIPREFDIKPSSHPRGEKLPLLLHTLHLEAQHIPYIYYFPFRVSRVLLA